MTEGPLESLNVSFMIIDIGFCRAVIQSLDTTEGADLPLLYSVMGWHVKYVGL
jgi:hypothetical protein